MHNIRHQAMLGMHCIAHIQDMCCTILANNALMLHSGVICQDMCKFMCARYQGYVHILLTFCTKYDMQAI